MNAEADKKKQEEIEIRNNADSLIYTSEKTIEELKEGQISEDEKSNVEKLVNELRELIAGDDLEAIKAKTEELEKIMQEIGAKIYQQAAAEAQAQQAANQEAGAQDNANAADDDTIDADYKVKED